MEGKRLSSNGPASSPEIAGGARFPQPNYNSIAVREALEHLATIDLIDLCTEAKIERCRAARDLGSCGRSVHEVLISCGHSSLCAECSQRYDLCPICRVSIPKTGNRIRLRLYDECKQAGLISRRLDERLLETENGSQGDADVQRLYALFDVALENNLVSLICHYVTDVCMDESAVSSDPVTAFLLDEVVVKDWCKRVFRNILTELQEIYNLDVEQMKSRFSLLLKFSVQLRGVSNVLEVLDSSFKDSLSPQLHDLHYLNECILKMKQHLEVMMWCIRHKFLENVRSRHTNDTSWRSIIRERKSAAIKRSWPDVINSPAESNIQDGSLFIEDALRNLEVDGESINETEGLDLLALQKNGGSLFLRSKIGGLFGCYPFENLRVAVDTLFLYGSSDLVVAKLAIFLYYLYDRHWTLPDEEWREIVDDFGATFRITRHSLLESLTFYLLDDHTEEALEEACHLLPEISNPTTHPKIAQVLLERQMPEIALMVLRWSGHDGGTQFQSLPEAVTAVRVRVECGLLTEAFTHQRMLCTKVREKKQRLGAWHDPSDDCQGQGRTWMEWMEILVTEICCLCIRRKFVDRIIELPWNSDEEKYLHKCLLDYAIEDPSNIIGSLLVVFYLQRQRYSEAHKVDRELQRLEEDFQSSNPLDEELVSRMQAVSKWRSMLIGKSLELLPEVLQQQIKSGTYPDSLVSSNKPVEMSELPSQEQGPSSTSLLFSSLTDSSLLLQKEGHSTLFPEPVPLETPVSSLFPNQEPHSASRDRSLMNIGRGLRPQFGILPKSSKVNEVSTPRRYTRTASPRSSSKFLENSHIRETSPNQFSPETEQNRFLSSINYNSPYSSQKTAASNKSDQQYYSFPTSEPHQKNLSGKRLYSSTDERPWNVDSSEDPMDVTWSGTKAYAVEGDVRMAAPRWRSDEEEEGEEPVELPYAAAPPSRGARRSRFAIR